jgi:hypothetical protein
MKTSPTCDFCGASAPSPKGLVCMMCLQPLGQRRMFVRNLALFMGGFCLFQGLALALRGCQ